MPDDDTYPNTIVLQLRAELDATTAQPAKTTIDLQNKINDLARASADADEHKKAKQMAEQAAAATHQTEKEGSNVSYVWATKRKHTKNDVFSHF